MANGIYTSLSGAMAQTRQVEMLSHNLANLNSSGFQQMKSSISGTAGIANADELAFAQLQPIRIDTRTGNIQSTDNEMDIALVEGVYLAVQDGNQEAYVRGGTMLIRPDGMMVTGTGRAVLGQEGPVRIPPGTENIQFNPDGTIASGGMEVDRLRLVELPQPELLESIGSAVRYRGAPQITDRERVVMPGYLEDANVNMLKGMTDLITAHRSYEAQVQMIKTHNEVERMAAREIVGRL